MVYLDDIIVYSNDFENHLRDIQEVLRILVQAGLSLKLSKCHFFKKEVEYLGHIIRPGTLEVDQARLKSLKKVTVPRTLTQLRSFLGLCNVYRRFVANYAKVAQPLDRASS